MGNNRFPTLNKN